MTQYKHNKPNFHGGGGKQKIKWHQKKVQGAQMRPQDSKWASKNRTQYQNFDNGYKHKNQQKGWECFRNDRNFQNGGQGGYKKGQNGQNGYKNGQNGHKNDQNGHKNGGEKSNKNGGQNGHQNGFQKLKNESKPWFNKDKSDSGQKKKDGPTIWSFNNSGKHKQKEFVGGATQKSVENDPQYRRINVSKAISGSIQAGAKRNALEELEFIPAKRHTNMFEHLKTLKEKYHVLRPKDLPARSESLPSSSTQNAVKSAASRSGVPTPRITISSPMSAAQCQWRAEQRKPRLISTGLNNCGNTCFLNATIQVLVHTAPLWNYLSQDRNIEKAKRGQNGNYQHQQIPQGFSMLDALQMHILSTYKKALNAQYGFPQPLTPTKILHGLNVIAKNMRVGRQEDAHEYLRYVLEAMQKGLLHEARAAKKITCKIEKECLHVKSTTKIHRIFGGYTRSRIVCLQCKTKSDCYEPCLDLQLDLKGAQNIQECLIKNFHRKDMLHGENAYRCQRCKKKQTATKQMVIAQAPQVLTLQLKRFDAFAGGLGMGGKIGRKILYPPTLNVARIMAEELRCTEMKYELYAVLVHSGYSCNAGHYYSYCKSPNGNWSRFNDSSVNQVKAGEALNQEEAYLLFYNKITVEPQHDPAPKISPRKTASVPTSLPAKKSPAPDSPPLKLPSTTDLPVSPRKPLPAAHPDVLPLKAKIMREKAAREAAESLTKQKSTAGNPTKVADAPQTLVSKISTLVGRPATVRKEPPLSLPSVTEATNGFIGPTTPKKPKIEKPPTVATNSGSKSSSSSKSNPVKKSGGLVAYDDSASSNTSTDSNVSVKRAKFLQRKADRSAKLGLDTEPIEKSPSPDQKVGISGDCTPTKDVMPPAQEPSPPKQLTLLEEIQKPQKIQAKELLNSTFGTMNVDTWEGGKTSTDKSLTKAVKKQGVSALDKFDLEYDEEKIELQERKARKRERRKLAKTVRKNHMKFQTTMNKYQMKQNNRNRINELKNPKHNSKKS